MQYGRLAFAVLGGAVVGFAIAQRPSGPQVDVQAKAGTGDGALRPTGSRAEGSTGDRDFEAQVPVAAQADIRSAVQTELGGVTTRDAIAGATAAEVMDVETPGTAIAPGASDIADSNSTRDPFEVLDKYWWKDFRSVLIEVTTIGIFLGSLQHFYALLQRFDDASPRHEKFDLTDYVTLPADLEVFVSVLGVAVTIVIARSAFRVLGGSIVSAVEAQRLDGTLEWANRALSISLLAVGMNNLFAPPTTVATGSLTQSTLPALFLAAVCAAVASAPIRLGVPERAVGVLELRVASAEVGLAALRELTGHRVRRPAPVRVLIELGICLGFTAALGVSFAVVPFLTGRASTSDVFVVSLTIWALVGSVTLVARGLGSLALSGNTYSLVTTTIRRGRVGAGWSAAVGTSIVTSIPLMLAGLSSSALRSQPDQVFEALRGWEVAVSWSLGIATTLAFQRRYVSRPRSASRRQALNALPHVEAQLLVERSRLDELVKRQDTVNRLLARHMRPYMPSETR